MTTDPLTTLAMCSFLDLTAGLNTSLRYKTAVETTDSEQQQDEIQISNTMSSSQLQSPARRLQSIENCVEAGKGQFRLITRPELLYKEQAGAIKMQLDKAFNQFWGSKEPSVQSRNEIARQAGELKALKENHPNILAKFKKAYDSQIAVVVQEMCDSLLPAMGPSYVRRALQKIPPRDLKDYLPANAGSGDKGSTVEARVGHPTAEHDEPGKVCNHLPLYIEEMVIKAGQGDN
jgi:hypothetical protein